MSEKDYIFKFDDSWKYKGVISGEMDKTAVEDYTGFRTPQAIDKKYVVEVIGFIWTDEQDDWHMKLRLKYPSGNKQAFGNSYGKNASETIVLQDMYRLPMINKHWFKNKDGTLRSLIQLMKDNDLIESIRIQVME